jgi:uncharacterized protein YbbC (DUF1343 family)/CubicO group peptidase (beta-lactamase class C family)
VTAESRTRSSLPTRSDTHRSHSSRTVILAWIGLLFLSGGCRSIPATGDARGLAADTALSSPVASLPDALLARFDQAVETALSREQIIGGVLAVETPHGSYHQAWGRRAVVPRPEEMTTDTIFDVASLTKVVATAPAIMILVDRGLVDLDLPVMRYIPEFSDGLQSEVTVRHLLTHTSALNAGLRLSEAWSGYPQAIDLAVGSIPSNRPGSTFRYSDVNFILLGEIVQRVSGESLARFVEREIYTPLGMSDTKFDPPLSSIQRVAPTEQVAEGMLRATVHDPTARRMGGVAGHAGLFTTARDLSRFVRMILDGGSLDGVRVLSPVSVETMISVQTPLDMPVRRGLGWDIDSIYSRPRGHFPLGSFGHTGWTGSFLWIDPRSSSFLIFLSNRVHPDGTGTVLPLQETLGFLSSEAAGYREPDPAINILPWRGGSTVLNGIDVLIARQFTPLVGRRIGLITNHTGRDLYGNRTIDVLRSGDLTLATIFSPEHGLRGDLDDTVPDGFDDASGLPIFSLYGERRKPAPEQLVGIDALVYDIQDIGSRFYTYISTMGLAMEAAAEADLPFVVLDRINPINGVAVEGPVELSRTGFTAYHPIAVRHGMTVGELARMFRAEREIDVDLTVISLAGWKRDHWQDDTALPWFDTSPNIRNLRAATLYPAIGLLESMALSVGRGTATPFEWFGAPYIRGEELARALSREVPSDCLRFTPAAFTPESSVYAGEHVEGVRIEIVDREHCNMVRTGLTIARELHRLYPSELGIEKLESLLRDPAAVEAVRLGRPIDAIVARWEAEHQKFLERRKRYLLYE